MTTRTEVLAHVYCLSVIGGCITCSCAHVSHQFYSVGLRTVHHYQYQLNQTILCMCILSQIADAEVLSFHRSNYTRHFGPTVHVIRNTAKHSAYSESGLGVAPGHQNAISVVSHFRPRGFLTYLLRSGRRNSNTKQTKANCQCFSSCRHCKLMIDQNVRKISKSLESLTWR